MQVGSMSLLRRLSRPAASSASSAAAAAAAASAPAASASSTANGARAAIVGCSAAAGRRGCSNSAFPRHSKPDPNMLTGAARGALLRIEEEEATRRLPDAPGDARPPSGALVVRGHNRPALAAGSNFPMQIYPAHPHNFTPLRPIQPGFASLDRAVREIPWESRFDLLERRIAPKYAGECPGTPRREIQDGMVGGVRVRPVQNPYVELTAAKRYRLNSWPSRNWDKWTALRNHVRGSRRKYRLPEDIRPYRDELGEWHPPRVSGRYKADMEKQYYMNSLYWTWGKDFGEGKVHYMDAEPKGDKRWYIREYKKAQIAEALKLADQMVEDYRKEKRDSKRLSWIENLVVEFAGEQMASPYVRQRRLPKF